MVEDDQDQALLVGRWLTKLNDIAVTVVTNAESALRLIRERDFDVIVSDVELPGMNGIDLVQQARLLRPFLMTALMTSNGTMEYAMKAIASKADRFILKPLDRKDFFVAIENLIRAAKKIRECSRETVLAIGAHPDDVEIGCGGILWKHRENGDRVVVLTLSSGEQGGASSLRILESRASAKFLGAEIRIGDLTDTKMRLESELIERIALVVDELQPTVVYTHTANDTHQDHRAVHDATVIAARKVRNLLCYQSPSSTTSFCPSTFVDIGDVLSKKIEMIACFESQVSKCAYLEESLIRATARYWGRFAGNGIVEPLEVIRSTVYGVTGDRSFSTTVSR